MCPFCKPVICIPWRTWWCLYQADMLNAVMSTKPIPSCQMYINIKVRCTRIVWYVVNILSLSLSLSLGLSLSVFPTCHNVFSHSRILLISPLSFALKQLTVYWTTPNIMCLLLLRQSEYLLFYQVFSLFIIKPINIYSIKLFSRDLSSTVLLFPRYYFVTNQACIVYSIKPSIVCILLCSVKRHTVCSIKNTTA